MKFALLLLLSLFAFNVVAEISFIKVNGYNVE